VRFLDWAAEAGQRVWQLLPLGPTGAGYSPYTIQSVFAGNPLLISPGRLEQRGWLPAGTVGEAAGGATNRIDFQRVIPWKERLLRQSWSHFQAGASLADRRELQAFVEHPGQAEWLQDWALFAALKQKFQDRGWPDWDDGLRRRSAAALRAATRDVAEELAYQRYLQFLFFTQWTAVHEGARQRGIAVLGDVPFYVDHDSADVWKRPELFQLTPDGRPRKVAGVPPDAFSEQGQRWGNPLYDWDRLAADGYRWWISRVQAALRQADWVRLDHFRAFESYWEIDADRPGAMDGCWRPGPGEPLFDALRREIGELPLVAEDLGDITPEVRRLRDRLGLAGMRILQFGIGDPASEHHPNRHPENSVVYTGTHDNDTARGWFEALDAGERGRIRDILWADDASVVRRLIETGYGSASRVAIVPLQDLFDLGSEARMNLPGVEGDNWSWRARPECFTLQLAAALRNLAASTGR